MKRTLAILLPLALTLVTIAATADVPMTFRIRSVLERALQNEREAVTRYETYAIKAAEEGYPGAACLFRAAARAERIHASRFEKAMRDRGIAIPEPAAYEPKVGSTSENLRAAAAAEMAERDGIYRDAIAAASDARDAQLERMFDQTRDTEVEHLNLMLAAGRNLDEMRNQRSYFVCDDCGYTSELDLPLCALCRARHAPHKVQ